MIPLLLAVVAGCSSAPAEPPFSFQLPEKYPTTKDGYRTLVVYNKLAPGSKELAEYYAVKRGLPPEDIVPVGILNEEGTSLVEVQKNLMGQVRAKIDALKTINRRIDFIVLCKGIPIRSWDNSAAFSVDSHLAAMNLKTSWISKDPPPMKELQQLQNPYFAKDEPFNSDKFGIYLVTRLDGYTYADARKLVDNSMAAKKVKGPFLLDSDPSRQTGGYKPLEDDMILARDQMKQRGFDVDYDATKTFVDGGKPLAGYASWGSNDGAFNGDTYRKIKFLPGAIAETFVSTSARTFKPGTLGGQSLIGDLIANGVTGIKGYVNEPFAIALARPNIMFNLYTSGRNLAESFYAASPMIKWRDVVIGDPLCAPYK